MAQITNFDMFTQQVATIIMLISPAFFLAQTYINLKHPESIAPVTFFPGATALIYQFLYYNYRADIASIINTTCWLIQYSAIAIRFTFYYVQKSKANRTNTAAIPVRA